MFKRLLSIGLLCIGLIALVSTEAVARCRVVGGILKCSSVCPLTLLSGVGNPEINPVAVCVGINVRKASVFCRNKGDNSETAQGKPFNLNAVITSADFVEIWDLTNQRGDAEVEWCWEDRVLYEKLKRYIPPPDSPNYPCQNRNWEVLPGLIIVQEAYAYYQAYVEDAKDPDSCMDLADSKCRYCNYGSDQVGCYYLA